MEFRFRPPGRLSGALAGVEVPRVEVLPQVLARGGLIAAKQPVPEGSLLALCHGSLLTAGIFPHLSLTSRRSSVQGSEGRTAPRKNGRYARARTPTSDSAIWTAFVAAPLRRLSATHQYWIIRPSTRTRPT